jgi:hypothetical protein
MSKVFKFVKKHRYQPYQVPKNVKKLLEEKKNLVKEMKMILDEKKTILDEKKKLLDEKKTLLEENKFLLKENKKMERQAETSKKENDKLSKLVREIEYHLTETEPDFDDEINERAKDIFTDYQNGYLSNNDSDADDSDAEDKEVDFINCKQKAMEEYYNSEEFQIKSAGAVMKISQLL